MANILWGSAWLNPCSACSAHKQSIISVGPPPYSYCNNYNQNDSERQCHLVALRRGVLVLDFPVDGRTCAPLKYRRLLAACPKGLLDVPLTNPAHGET